MAKKQAKKKAVRKIEKAVRKALNKGVLERDVDQTVEQTIETVQSKKGAGKKPAQPKTAKARKNPVKAKVRGNERG
jgi:cobalamin-dependent methionine synthase I